MLSEIILNDLKQLPFNKEISYSYYCILTEYYCYEIKKDCSKINDFINYLYEKLKDVESFSVEKEDDKFLCSIKDASDEYNTMFSSLYYDSEKYNVNENSVLFLRSKYKILEDAVLQEIAERMVQA